MSDDQSASDDRRARESLIDRLSRPTPTVWLSGAEAAECVGLSWPTKRQFIREHDVPHVPLGMLYKIDVAMSICSESPEGDQRRLASENR